MTVRWCREIPALSVAVVVLTAIAPLRAEQPPPAVQAPAKVISKPRFAASADGTRIAYDVTGSGPAIILVHGGGQTRASWHERGYVDRLSKRFTVITIDRRGSGDSDKPAASEAYALDRVLPDFLAVADAAGAKRFHLYGYGHGGTFARYLAARSDRVISAVMVESPIGPAVTGIVRDGLAAMRAKWQAALSDKRETPNDTAISALAHGALLDYPPVQPAEIKAPTLWIVGSGDASAMDNVKEYEGKLSGTNVTLKVLAGATYPDCFLRLADILADVEPFLAK